MSFTWASWSGDNQIRTWQLPALAPTHTVRCSAGFCAQLLCTFLAVDMAGPCYSTGIHTDKSFSDQAIRNWSPGALCKELLMLQAALFRFLMTSYRDRCEGRSLSSPGGSHVKNNDIINDLTTMMESLILRDFLLFQHFLLDNQLPLSSIMASGNCQN